MIRSMTGFAEKRFSFRTLSARISIKTLNHRYLDWNYRGSQIGTLEDRLRSLCQKKLYRGRVEIFMDLSFLNPARWEVLINEDLLKKILKSLDKAASSFDRPMTFAVENVLSVPHVVEFRAKDLTAEEIDFLEKSFVKALDMLLRERQREGKEIAGELRPRVQKAKNAVSRLEKLAKMQPLLIRKKLMERLNELGQEGPLSEEKIAEEASFLAQRYDLAEEIARLKSHLLHFSELLSPDVKEPVGKKLDFVTQELFREANTINSKAQNISVVKEGLSIKGEIESIRQQVQNLE
jgi:uncharacterized protein (TIGR00255 family)